MHDYYDLGTYSRPVTTNSSEAQVWFDRSLVRCYAKVCPRLGQGVSWYAAQPAHEHGRVVVPSPSPSGRFPFRRRGLLRCVGTAGGRGKLRTKMGDDVVAYTLP
jgi:hypothetical protein